VEGERRKTECGRVGAVRDNMPTVIQRKEGITNLKFRAPCPFIPMLKAT